VIRTARSRTSRYLSGFTRKRGSSHECRLNHIRESILLLLAQNGPLTAAEIYEKIDTVETKQFLYAQINYLKKEGKILASS
jgi:hypothetical protein